MAHGFESPAIVRKGPTYFFLRSNLTGCERNDNYYDTAPALSGPWTKQGASDAAHATVSVTLTGTQASLYSVARRKEVMASSVDTCGGHRGASPTFVTPRLAQGTCTFSAAVVGDGGYAVNKKGERSGSTGHVISFERLAVRR